jgi:hypothetical protein
MEEFKYMKKTEELPEVHIYAPYIPITNGVYINDVQVWGHRWWMNILCKINRLFHFRKRKMQRKYKEAFTDFNKFIKYSNIKGEGDSRKKDRETLEEIINFISNAGDMYSRPLKGKWLEFLEKLK